MSSSTRKPEDLPLDNIPNLESDPRSAQESVLFSDDLISEIFEYLTIDPRFVQSGFDPENYKKLRETRGHLLGVALVCRSFREPALDLLWRSMESIIPLLKLLPRNNLELSNGQYTLYGRLSQALSTGSFNRYATRVRIFVHNPTLYEQNRNTLYAWLPLFAQSVSAGTHIFPRLDTLVISQFDLNDNQVLALLSPSLRRVNITWPNQETWPLLATLFTCLLNRAPQLHHLAYCGRMVPQLHRLLCPFTELRSLEVGKFSAPRNSSVQHHWPSAISVFSSMAHLQKLSLDILDYDNPNSTPLNPISTPSLTYLRLQGQPSLLANLKLLKGAMGSLQEIRLDLSPRANSGNADITWDDFTLEFASLCKSWLNLRKLKLAVYNTFADFPVDGSLDSLFNSILQLSELTFLDIKFSVHQTTISEDLAFKLIGSYPHLEHLNILFYNFNISHDKLAKIATLCPHLLYLGIGIRLDQLPKDDFHPQHPALEHPLRTLSTSHYPPKSNYVVARYLLRSFPNLEKIETTAQTGWQTGALQLIEFGRSTTLDGHNRNIPRSS